jgi:hypothetical protein
MTPINTHYSPFQPFGAPVQETEPDAAAQEEPNWVPERPTLTRPEQQGYSEYRLLMASEDSRKLGEKIFENLSSRVNILKDSLSEISAQVMEKLREAAQRASESGFWSILKKIGTCLVSALSLVFGFAVLGAGGSALIGGAMIASGILSLANFALTEVGAWDWVSKQLASGNEEKRKQLQMILPGAFGLLAGGIGLVGSVAGVATGAVQFVEKAVSAAQTALAIFNGLVTFGKGTADARLLWTESDLLVLKGEQTQSQELFSNTLGEVQSFMNESKALKNKVKEAIRNVSQSNIELARGV